VELGLEINSRNGIVGSRDERQKDKFPDDIFISLCIKKIVGQRKGYVE